MRNVAGFLVLFLVGCAVAQAQRLPMVCVESTERACFTSRCGPCAAGKQICQPGGTRWGACIAEEVDRTEMCMDLVDNDCDCVADEECNSL